MKLARRPATRLLLARHGQSVFNRENRITGGMDPPLTEAGVEQATRLAEHLRGDTVGAVYASPLRRAVDTARPAAAVLGVPLREVETLRELRFGSLEGRFRDARDAEVAALWTQREADPVAFRPPEGEDFTEFADRIAQWVAASLERHRGDAFLVVAHRNTNRAVLRATLGWPLDIAARFRVRSGSLYEIDVEGTRIEEFRLRDSSAKRPAEAVGS